MFTYSFELEKIGDEIERLWRVNIESKIKKNTQIKQIALLCAESLALAFDFYFQFKPDLAEKITLLRNKVREAAFSLKADKDTPQLIYHLIKISEEVTDLSHLALMKSL